MRRLLPLSMLLLAAACGGRSLRDPSSPDSGVGAGSGTSQRPRVDLSVDTVPQDLGAWTRPGCPSARPANGDACTYTPSFKPCEYGIARCPAGTDGAIYWSCTCGADNRLHCSEVDRCWRSDLPDTTWGWWLRDAGVD